MTTRQLKLKELLTQLETFGKPAPVKNQAFQLVSPDFFDTLNTQIKQGFDLSSVVSLVKEVQTQIEQSEQDLRNELENQIASIPQTPDLTKDVAKLRTNFETKIKTLQDANATSLQSVETKLQEFIDKENKEDLLFKVELERSLKDIRTEVISRTANRGGSMNRQIRVEGVDVLKRYTDINIYGVSSSVITSVDDVKKRVNIGIQGGGGSSASSIGLYTNSVLNGSQGTLNLTQGTNITVSDNGTGTITISASAGSVVAGITRIASVISVSSTLAAAALTDYVMFANVGIQVTLPTAISNSNLYTIKNLSVSSVLIGVSAGQTIDGSSTALLPVQYQSLDLMSNGSVWGVI